MKEGDSVPSTVVVAIGVGVGVGSVGVDVQAISANTKAGTARTCHPVRFEWSRRLAVAKSNSPIPFLHSQRDIKDKHSILEHRGLHSHLGFPVCSHGLSVCSSLTNHLKARLASTTTKPLKLSPPTGRP